MRGHVRVDARAERAGGQGADARVHACSQDSGARLLRVLLCRAKGGGQNSSCRWTPSPSSGWLSFLEKTFNGGSNFSSPIEMCCNKLTSVRSFFLTACALAFARTPA